MKRILVAVDNSSRAPDVFRAAVELAAAMGASLHLFRAAWLPPDLPPAAATAPEPLERQLADQVVADLVALAHGSSAVIERPSVGTRAPWREVLDAARRVDADLVVIGSHGFGGWDHVLGTNAARITDHADRSVLVVHERPARR